MAKQCGGHHVPMVGTILMADDDADDCLLVQEALRESNQPHELRIVRDGQQLLDYLRRRGDYRPPPRVPRPDLILLDLKMPRKDGREALSEVKADPRLRSIPIVVLTTSTAGDDIGFCYRMGVNSYITKPATFRGLVDLLDTLIKYWFEIVELPVFEPDRHEDKIE
jgi:CheY-like chemotaxis protein